MNARTFLRQRFLILGVLPHAGVGLLTVASLTLLLRALVSAGTALATIRAIDQLMAGSGVLAAVVPVVLVLLVGEVLEHLMEPMQFAIRRRIDGRHRRRVAEAACAPSGVAHLESAGYQNDLRRAAGEPDNWTEGTPGVAAWAQLALLFAYLDVFLAAAVIARDLPLLAAALLAVLLACRAVQRRELLGTARVWSDGLDQRRRAEYWTSVLTEPGTAKEVRIFGLSGYAGRLHRTFTDAHLQPFRASKTAKLRRQWFWLFVLAGMMSVTVYVLGRSALGGDLPVAHLAGNLAAAAAMIRIAMVNPAMVELEAGLPPLLALERLRRWPVPPVPPELAVSAEPVDGGRPGSAIPTVRFEHVRFGYPGGSTPVLTDLDLELRPGEVLALVGLNGAGKTTIVKLLAGLYRPDGGRILVDGVDLADLDVGRWRERLAVVFQDFLRYPLSAADNITLGPDGRAPDPDGLRAALADAGIADLVNGLPEGPDTLLSPGGSGGTDLSGGQWQRVALARALYAMRRGARVLVLDEPTANLDIRTEVEVFQQLARAATDASVVLISHRLSTVRQADRIVLVEAGAVRESGTHDELMAHGGAYAAMFLAQSRRVLGDPGEAEVVAQ